MLSTAVIPDSIARTVARDVLRPYAWLPAALYWPTDALSAALLPIPLRESFGLRYGLTQRLFYRAVIVALRALRGILPRWVTVVPQARRFESAMKRRGEAI